MNFCRTRNKIIISQEVHTWIIIPRLREQLHVEENTFLEEYVEVKEENMEVYEEIHEDLVIEEEEPGIEIVEEINENPIIEKDLEVLEKLSIEHCPQLMEVPSGVQHLRNLSELIFTNMPSEFEQSLDPKQGSHYWIIEHVPFIILRHKVRKGIFGYETHNLSSKYLERSKGTTINQADDTNNNNGDDINASDDKG